MYLVLPVSMGLAKLLKRKVSGLKATDETLHDVENERLIERKIAALEGKSSRTARRKLRKLTASMHVGRQRKQHLPFPSESDDTSADSEKSIEEEDEDEDGEAGALRAYKLQTSLAPPSGQSAYEALLASLAENNESILQAYHRRQKELKGDSDSSDSSDSSESSDYGDKVEDDFLDHPSERLKSDEDLESDDDSGATSNETGNSEQENSDEPHASSVLKRSRDEHGATPLHSKDYYGNAHFERQLTEDEISRLARNCGNEKTSGPGVDFNSFHDVEDSKLQAVWEPRARLQISATNVSTLPRPPLPTKLADHGIKERLITRWQEMRSGNSSMKTADKVNIDWGSPRQHHFFALLSTFCDVLYPCHPYPKSTEAEDLEMDAVLLHILNHIFQNADKIKKNNERTTKTKGSEGDVPRDQGFTRPKVLILLPLRNQAFKIIQRLLLLAVHETRTDSIQNKERFVLEYGPSSDDIDEGDEANVSKRRKNGINGVKSKPEEHQALFWGNIDDHFRLGIKITKGAVKLYADFYQSDILVASPLALATKIAEGSKEGGGVLDFLSSIEVLVLERADVMLMQNWMHVQSVVKALNHLPHEQRNVDIMRVREWYLAGHAKHYRQTIVMSSFLAPEFNALLTKECCNYAGRVRWVPQYRSGVMKAIAPGIRQIFERIGTVMPPSPSVESPENDPDARFHYFTSNVWPRIREASRGGGQLLYIPSYFDYVRVRNFLRGESASFTGLCEYTARSEMARSRTFFADGRVRVLLYTERAQFYNRHRIRGIKDIFFYQLPEHPQFYLELVNYIEEGTTNLGVATVTVLFSKFDALRLQRVVGMSRCKAMIRPESRDKNALETKQATATAAAGTFIFC